jgi:hypothetical protein
MNLGIGAIMILKQCRIKPIDCDLKGHPSVNIIGRLNF